MVAEGRVARRSVLALLAGLAACSDPDDSYRNRVDTGWHRDDLEALLLHWHTHAVRPDGSFQLHLDRGWKPRPAADLELAGQAGLVYAFAVGHEIFPDAGYLKVARQGASFLLQRFHDPQHGGFFEALTADGMPRTDLKRASSHAKVLHALSELYRVSGDVRFREAAEQAWREIAQGFSDPVGGLHDECSRDFQPQPGPRTQRGLMQMFDALLAMRAASGDAAAEAGARQLGDFVVNKLLATQPDGSAYIAESYTQAWEPLPSREAGAYVDLGHQFAWSYLLARGAVLSPAFAQAGDRVLIYALATGYDENSGGCAARAYADGSKPDASKGWWQQAECLHALMVAAQASSRTEMWRRYEKTLALIKDQLIDADHGGWRAATSLPCGVGGCGDEQPDPYPIVRLHHAALKVTT